ncbi:MAG: hypothetical protein WC708_02555 [Lentisphaeria bacterium]
MISAKQAIGIAAALALAVLLAAAGWRAGQLQRGLEYDEIWTLTHYVPKPWPALAFDLATPNNHPLHTLFAARTLELGGGRLAAYRLPSFLAGLATLLLLPLLAWRLTRSVWAAAAALLLGAANGALAHFAVVARGYSLQTALLLLAAVLAMRNGRAADTRPVQRLLWIVPAFLALLTLPTTLLFLPGLCAVAWAAESATADAAVPPAVGCRSAGRWLPFRPPSRWLALAVVALGAACLVWLWQAWLPLAAARARFSQPFPGCWGHLAYGWQSLAAVAGGGAVLALAALGLGWGRAAPVLRLAVAVNLLVPWLGMAFTGLGPDRAWLPVVPWLIAAAAAGLDRLVTLPAVWRPGTGGAMVATLRLVILALFGVVLLAAADSARARWTAPDWAALFNTVRQQCPPDMVVVWPATSGYCVRFQAGTAAVADTLARLEAPTSLLQLGSASGVSAADQAGGERWIPAAAGRRPAEAEDDDWGLDTACWRLAPLPPETLPAAAAAGTPLLAVLPTRPVEVSRALEKRFREPGAGEWCLLNLWLGGAVAAPTGAPPRAASAWILAGPLPRTPQAAAWCRGLAAQGVRFYQLAAATD